MCGSMHIILTTISQNLEHCKNLFRAPSLPAASPAIFMGEEARGSGHDLERNYRQCFVFHLFSRTLQTHGQYVFENVREKTSKFMPVRSAPLLLHEMRGYHDLTLQTATPLSHARKQSKNLRPSLRNQPFCPPRPPHQPRWLLPPWGHCPYR